MKKIMIAAAIVCATAFVQAASVGWNNAGLKGYVGDAYGVFVIGQNGVTSIADFTANVLEAGKDWSSYAIGSGKVASNGAATQAFSVAGAPTLDAGTYTSFFVLFDGADPKAGENKFVVLDGIDKQTQTVGASTANITFASGNAGTALASKTWSGFGSSTPTPPGGDGVPEPTSGILLALGMAGLALRRKQK